MERQKEKKTKRTGLISCSFECLVQVYNKSIDTDMRGNARWNQNLLPKHNQQAVRNETTGAAKKHEQKTLFRIISESSQIISWLQSPSQNHLKKRC